MATVQEILEDPAGACGVPDDGIPVRAIILIEYVRPDAEDSPDRPRLGYCADSSMAPWQAMGMLRFAEQLDFHAVGAADDEDNDE